MKPHIFIASGLLIAAIFFMRGLDALSEPGFSLQDIYIQNLVQDIRIPGQRQAHGMAEGGMDPAG